MFASNTSQVSNGATYIEDVFSTYLYTGTAATQTITNGIDLAGKGGMIWLKQRNGIGDHGLLDTARGAGNVILSNATAAQTFYSNLLSSFNSNGFTLGSDSASGYIWNGSPNTYASWTFRKQPKFFDVVTYTGTGANRTIAHNLGSVPGCIIVKRTDTTSNWQVYHNGLTSAAYTVQLNSTGAQVSSPTVWNSTAPTSTEFSLGTSTTVNGSTGTYVAYLFAHNAGGFGLTGTDNVISCGSYTGTGASYGPQVDLGFEPQFVMIKAASTTGSWAMFDNMRGIQVSGPDQRLYADTSGAEATTGGNGIEINATGFRANETFAYINGSGQTYIYIAIRRGPMKTPTSGTSVLSLQTYTGDDSTRTLTTGFPVDLAIGSSLSSSAGNSATFSDRLRGTNNYMNTASTGAEVIGGNSLTGFDIQTGVGVNGPSNYVYNFGSIPYVLPALRRAPGFFDEVCYTGTGANRTVNHNLGVAPELMIVKTRNNTIDWCVYSAPVGNTRTLYLNRADAQSATSAAFWNNTTPTSSVFTVGIGAGVNDASINYVTYLFASCPGVSKVGSYTGNGSSQTINCGFTGGARFVLIKRTDSTGDWYVYDTARGMVSGNDPYLLWNANGNQVTGTNYVFTSSTGFTIQASAPVGINASGGSYIYLAIA